MFDIFKKHFIWCIALLYETSETRKHKMTEKMALNSHNQLSKRNGGVAANYSLSILLFVDHSSMFLTKECSALLTEKENIM